MTTFPILANKEPDSPSVFTPQALLREARRQKGLASEEVPGICILDPDGDIVRRLRHTGEARPFAGWPCYHTELSTFPLAGRVAQRIYWPSSTTAPCIIVKWPGTVQPNCQVEASAVAVHVNSCMPV